MSHRLVHFLQPVGLELNRFLIGHHRFETKVQLRKVSVQARAVPGVRPGGVTRLNLVVGGVATEVVVDVVTPSGPNIELVRVTQDLNYVVPANMEVRWQCIEVPGVAEAWLQEWHLSLTYSDEGELLLPAALFKVRWAQAGVGQSLDLYGYDPATRVFSEVVAGVSEDRAKLGQTTAGGTFSVTFAQGWRGLPVALAAASNDLRFGRLIDNHSTGTAEVPRLEFWIGAQRVASLTRSGQLRVLKTREVNGHGALVAGSDRFCFEFEGSLRATIGIGTGLESGKLVELL